VTWGTNQGATKLLSSANWETQALKHCSPELCSHGLDQWLLSICMLVWCGLQCLEECAVHRAYKHSSVPEWQMGVFVHPCPQDPSKCKQTRRQQHSWNQSCAVACAWLQEGQNPTRGVVPTR